MIEPSRDNDADLLKRMPIGRGPVAWVGFLIFAAVSIYLGTAQHGPAPTASPPSAVVHSSGAVQADSGVGDVDFAALARDRRSNVQVESAGVVFKVLPDDTEGDQHERFLVRVGANTILIAHNIDLAERAPVREGDSIRFRGEYEWNDRGGVVHWTHRDPAHRHGDGWIEIAGKRYQ